MTFDHDDDRTFTPALLGLIWAAMFGFSGFFLTYSTVVTVAAQSGLSTVTGGSVLTTMMLGVIVAQPFAPGVGRALGTKAALLLAVAAQVLGQLLSLAVNPPLLGLVLAGLSGGVGFGLFVVLANAAVPGTTSPRYLGRALGYFGSITSLAAAFGSPLGLWLVGAVPVWAFRLVACLVLLLAVPAIVWLLPGRSTSRPRSEPRKDRTAQDDRDSPAEAAPAPRGRQRSFGGILRLLIMLAPFLIGMITFGVIVGFGPGTEVVGPALFIGLMQIMAVVGRFVAGIAADRWSPRGLNLLGVVIAVVGLVLTAFSPASWTLALAMVIVGLGLGTMQSASLVMAFNEVSTPGRASVAWNMNFDIGLAIAGVLGGIGFTYLGDSSTFLVCAGLLFIAGVLALMLGPARRER